MNYFRNRSNEKHQRLGDDATAELQLPNSSFDDSLGLKDSPQSACLPTRTFVEKERDLEDLNVSVEVELELKSQGGDVFDGLEDATAATLDKKRPTKQRRCRSLLLLSDLFFVLGSALYMTMAVIDMQWASEARSVPLEVLNADDDVAWMNFRQEQRLYREQGGDAMPDGTGYATTRSKSTDRLGRRLTTFDAYGWADLPLEAQEAAAVMGYDEEIWDNGGDVATELLSWNELTQAQQEAAQVLGYSQLLWDGSTPAPTMELQVQTTVAPSTTGTVAPGSPSVPTLPYDGVDWSDLQEEVVYAAQVLGYNEEIWNDELPPGLVTSHNPNWDELTPEQQSAAQVLGYTADNWWFIRRNYTNFVVTVAVEEPGDDEEQPVDPDGTPAPVVEWELYDWSELPKEVQEAYGVLGYDEDKWTTGIISDISKLAWDDLSSDQQQAALYLGFTQALWEGTPAPQVGVEPGESNSTTPIGDEWRRYDWFDMPMEVRLAFSALEYTEEIWNSGGISEAAELSWEKLTVTQQAAAVSVGYTHETWGSPAGGTNPPVDMSAPAPDAQWYDFYWADLPPQVQAAYETLGYDQQIWDDGEKVATESVKWEGLTPAQQDAAAFLGFNQAIWDGSDPAAIETVVSFVSADDDYVFHVPRKSLDVWVSKYMILYFSAALCFVFVGLLDWFNERRLFRVLMIVAGLFGVVAAMLTEKDRIASGVCSLISVHLFLLEGLILIRNNVQAQLVQVSRDDDNAGEDSSQATPVNSDLWWIPTMELTADGCFVVGAFMEVVMSYFDFERSADWNMPLARANAFAVLLWIACSSMYLLRTLVVHFGLFSCCRSRHPRPVDAELDFQKSSNRALKDLDFVVPPRDSPTAELA